MAEEGLAVRISSGLHAAILLVVALLGCDTAVTEDCSRLTAEECGSDSNCALTFEHGCRNVCETEEDCTEGLTCREVAGAKYPGTGEDGNPMPRVVCLPP